MAHFGSYLATEISFIIIAVMGKSEAANKVNYMVTALLITVPWTYKGSTNILEDKNACSIKESTIYVSKTKQIVFVFYVLNGFLLPAYVVAVKPQQCCSPQHGAAGRSDAGNGPDLCSPAGIPALVPAKQSQDMHYAALKTTEN